MNFWREIFLCPGFNMLCCDRKTSDSLSERFRRSSGLWVIIETPQGDSDDFWLLLLRLNACGLHRHILWSGNYKKKSPFPCKWCSAALSARLWEQLSLSSALSVSGLQELFFFFYNFNHSAMSCIGEMVCANVLIRKAFEWTWGNTVKWSVFTLSDKQLLAGEVMKTSLEWHYRPFV